MSYTVKVANSVKAFLENIPREVRVHVYQRLLVDLPADPDNLLGEIVIPFAHKRTFQVITQDRSQQPPLGWWFVFVVDRGTPGELHVESVRDANQPEPN